MMPVESGLLAGRYELRRLRGAGPVGQVWEAHDRQTGGRVAVKTYHAHLCEDAAFRAAARRAAADAARIGHPAAVAVHDTGDGRFLVSEYVDGASVRELLERQRPLSPEAVVQLAFDICTALGAAHGQGVLHRNLKPENLLVVSGCARVSDFALAATVSGAGMPAAAPYLAPEVTQTGEGDARSDTYALGCCLYEMVTGQPPFEGPTPFAVAAKHAGEDPPPPRAAGAPVSPRLEAVILRALAKDPADRYESMRQLRSALQQVVLGRAAPEPQPARTVPAPPRHPTVSPPAPPPASPPPAAVPRPPVAHPSAADRAPGADAGGRPTAAAPPQGVAGPPAAGRRGAALWGHDAAPRPDSSEPEGPPTAPVPPTAPRRARLDPLELMEADRDDWQPAVAQDQELPRGPVVAPAGIALSLTGRLLAGLLMVGVLVGVVIGLVGLGGPEAAASTPDRTVPAATAPPGPGTQPVADRADLTGVHQLIALIADDPEAAGPRAREFMDRLATLEDLRGAQRMAALAELRDVARNWADNGELSRWFGDVAVEVLDDTLRGR